MGNVVPIGGRTEYRTCGECGCAWFHLAPLEPAFSDAVVAFDLEGSIIAYSARAICMECGAAS